MALTTTAFIQAALGLRDPDAAEYAQLDFCRSAAEAFLQEQCGRQFEKARRVEYYQGTGHRTLTLRQRPVWQVHDVRSDLYGYYGTKDGSFASETVLVAGTDYALDQDQPTPSSSGPLSRSGVLVRIGTTWPEVDRQYTPGRVSTTVGPSYGNVKVDYTAGYDPVPDDLKLAVAMLAALYKRLLPHGQMLESERIGDYSYTILTGRMMQQTHPVIGSIDRVINRYREVSF